MTVSLETRQKERGKCDRQLFYIELGKVNPEENANKYENLR